MLLDMFLVVRSAWENALILYTGHDGHERDVNLGNMGRELKNWTVAAVSWDVHPKPTCRGSSCCNSVLQRCPHDFPGVSRTVLWDSPDSGSGSPKERMASEQATPKEKANRFKNAEVVLQKVQQVSPCSNKSM